MILPNKDCSFINSLLYKSIIIYESLSYKTNINVLYDLYSDIYIKDLESILLFLYCIKKIDILGNDVIKLWLLKYIVEL